MRAICGANRGDDDGESDDKSFLFETSANHPVISAETQTPTLSHIGINVL